jgi:hypothetical protein
MLGSEVPRLKPFAVLLLALLTAGQLSLHHHSLNPETGQSLTCGVCAFSADSVDTATPAAIQLVVTATLLPATERPILSASPLALTTRGPPQL